MQCAPTSGGTDAMTEVTGSMNRSRRRVRALIVALVLGVLLTVAPFLIRAPSKERAVMPDDLADEDSRFIAVDGLRVHTKIAGHGDPALLLLHGFVASTFSWREVMARLAELGTVVAFDRPGFGLTSRPLRGEWAGANPYTREAHADLTVALMDRMGIGRAVLVGHSAGGTVAALVALRQPERVAALVLVAPAIYHEGSAPAAARLLLRTPQMRRLLPSIVRLAARSAGRIIRWIVDDPAFVTAEAVKGYIRPLGVEHWDTALWEVVVASRRVGVARRVGKITVPTLVITGDHDRVVPTPGSLRLARELPNARLVLMPQTGHLPQEERPEAFVAAVREFLRSLPEEPAR